MQTSQQVDDLAQRAIIKARIRLINAHPWFGQLALRLVVENGESMGVDTMATDGTRLYYCADTVANKWSQVELTGVIAHEIVHCAFLHMFRRGSRDMKLWNIACDYAINPILTQNGLKLPGTLLYDAKYVNWSAEKIYSDLGKNASKKLESGFGADSGYGIGGVMDAPTLGKGAGNGKDSGKGSGSGKAFEGVTTRTEADWVQDVIQAEKVCKAAGKLPGGLSDQLVKVRECKTPYREVLKRFLDRTVACDYRYSTPNRRLLNQGIVLPGLYKEGCGELAILVDTSGSVGDAFLAQFAGDIAYIQSTVKPAMIHVAYCDTRVMASESFAADGEPFQFAKKVGRGGTNFQPAFDWVQSEGHQIKAALYLTDLEPGDRPTDPGYPVLWCVPESCGHTQFAFGEVVQVAMDDAR